MDFAKLILQYLVESVFAAIFRLQLYLTDRSCLNAGEKQVVLERETAPAV